MNHQQADFGRPTLATRVVLAIAAFVTSATVLGGVLGLFDMQASDAAVAKASTPISVATPVATREVKSVGRS
jgi:hypothetical protein